MSVWVDILCVILGGYKGRFFGARRAVKGHSYFDLKTGLKRENRYDFVYSGVPFFIRTITFWKVNKP